MLFYLCVVVGSVIMASVYEWALHRYVMHKPVKTRFGVFDYPFVAHAKVHHQIFKADDSYHLNSHEDQVKDRETIPMEWWNGPVLCVIATLPTIALSILLQDWFITLIFFAVGITYYGIYEYIHWCMHLPRNHPMRLVERFTLFRLLNGHHLLHHRYMHKNFNVVLPLADLMFGTLLLKSKRVFPQPSAPQVPNVQPTLTE